jgi:hypothetical protein
MYLVSVYNINQLFIWNKMPYKYLKKEGAFQFTFLNFDLGHFTFFLLAFLLFL